MLLAQYKLRSSMTAKGTRLSTEQRPEASIFGLQVPDLHQAYIFYCDGLGFTQDPGTWSKQRGGFRVLWFNLGRHQVTTRCMMWPPWTYVQLPQHWEQLPSLLL